MIQEVRKGEEINSESLKKFLFESGLLSNHYNKLKILQFNNGFSNLTYLIKFENKETMFSIKWYMIEPNLPSIALYSPYPSLLR